MLDSYLASFLAMMMVAKCSSETMADFQWTTQHNIPNGTTLRHHHCGNRKYFVLYNNICIQERRNNHASDLANALLTACSAREYETKYIKLLDSGIQASGIPIPMPISKNIFHSYKVTSKTKLPCSYVNLTHGSLLSCNIAA
jgi:hypothetical protein